MSQSPKFGNSRGHRKYSGPPSLEITDSRDVKGTNVYDDGGGEESVVYIPDDQVEPKNITSSTGFESDISSSDSVSYISSADSDSVTGTSSSDSVSVTGTSSSDSESITSSDPDDSNIPIHEGGGAITDETVNYQNQGNATNISENNQEVSLNNLDGIGEEKKRYRIYIRIIIVVLLIGGIVASQIIYHDDNDREVAFWVGVGLIALLVILLFYYLFGAR